MQRKKAAAEKRRPGMSAEKWGHDLYDETEQAPRSTDEIVRRYGFDIRKHGLENAPSPRKEKGQSERRGAHPRGRGRGGGANRGDAREVRSSPTQRGREQLSPWRYA